jgi:gluconolactonase
MACGTPAAVAPEAGAPLPDAASPNAEGQPPTAGPAFAQPRPLPAYCQNANTEPPPALVQAALIRGGFVFVEGPVWSDQLGAFLFSEMDFNSPGPNGPPSKIHKLVLPAQVEVFIPDSGSNGLAIDGTGLVACTHDTQTLSRYDLGTHARSVFVSDYQSKHFNSPNDVALHSAGHTYFTDPDWQLGARPNQTGVTGVYWRNPQGQVALIDGELRNPNGISLSPDETRLYVGAANGDINVYRVMSDGSVGPRQKLANVPEADGMAVDCSGRLYVASHGPGEVVVLSPEGAKISTIRVAPRTTNVAFGGADHETLLITSGAGLYTVASKTPGFPY